MPCFYLMIKLAINAILFILSHSPIHPMPLDKARRLTVIVFFFIQSIFERGEWNLKPQVQG